MMAKRNASTTKLGDLLPVLQEIAPLELAQSWDNVGLLAGDPDAIIKRALLCIDLTPEVVAEAIGAKVQLAIAYHPPIFKPVSRLLKDSQATDAQVYNCIANGIAIYSMHTALDAADGGTNDVLAGLCGIKQTRPLQWAPDPSREEFKLVVFCPAEATDRVADALDGAGAGQIGEYRRCSFRIPGTGTFQGSEATTPAIGSAGVYETVEEIRLEMVVPKSALPAVVTALREVHPYEEPAFDVYPLQPVPRRGIGRIGEFGKPITLDALAKKLRAAVSGSRGAVSRSAASRSRATVSGSAVAGPDSAVLIVGDRTAELRRGVIVAGAGGSLVFQSGLGPGDVVITGELRHHDALTIRRHGASAVVLQHWTSERPVLGSVAERLQSAFPGVEFKLCEADAEPFIPA